jgi:hypothetical protein
MLELLDEHELWHPRAGWIWNTDGGTIRLLETLVKRGLVIRQVERLTPKSQIGRVDPTPYAAATYRLTPEGRQQVKEIRNRNNV